MIQKIITQDTETIARCYLKRLRCVVSIKKVICELEKLKSKIPINQELKWKLGRGKNISYTIINRKAIVDYIDLLEKHYDVLLLAHPRTFNCHIQKFEKLIGRDFINKPICWGGNEHESLSKQIVEVLKYKEVREKAYPKVARMLEIKTCVYCNANYAITDRDNNGFYELDHWKPKSLYPYLCTSFYNLQISCPYCNKRKSDNDKMIFFRLWNEFGGYRPNIFKFFISQQNISKYWITHDRNQIDIKFGFEKLRYKKMCYDTDKCLHITSRYKEHNDVAEEILWRVKAYNEGFYKSLIAGLEGLAVSESDRKRFILGTYCNENEVFKRPLSKMIFDVAKCAGLHF